MAKYKIHVKRGNVGGVEDWYVVQMDSTGLLHYMSPTKVANKAAENTWLFKEYPEPQLFDSPRECFDFMQRWKHRDFYNWELHLHEIEENNAVV